MGIWVEIQNVLLEVRPIGNVKGKIILLASAEPNHRIKELIKCKESYKVMGNKLITEVHLNLLKLSVGGEELEMLVDSGATNNIVDEKTGTI